MEMQFIRFPLVGGKAQSSKPGVFSEHVAVFAAFTDLCAAGGPVPCGGSPLY
jgi:hypothetical protein